MSTTEMAPQLMRKAVRSARRNSRVAATVPGLGPIAAWAARRLAVTSPRPFAVDEVLAVLDQLEADGVAAWLAGGWGVDALVGGQTRFHTDLELVVGDLLGDGPGLVTSLARRGFRPLPPRQTGLWWQQPSIDLRNGAGATVESLAIDWDLVETLAGLLVEGASTDGLRSDCFAVGTLAGRPVPCLSARAQRLLHRGYPARPTDQWDLRLLGDGGPPPAGGTSLVVPVFAFDEWAYRVWRELGPALRVPHITVLHPFAPVGLLDADLVGRLRSVLADVEAFDYVLADVRWFDDRVVYLRPDPDDPFLRLSAAVGAAFPGYPPYGGAYERMVPHLTMVENGSRAQLRHAATVSASLPLRARADEVWLMADEPPQLLRRFPLRT